MPTGKNKVLMAPLRAALTKEGLQDVQTYIQSGNVIAESNLTPAEIEALVHEVIIASPYSRSRQRYLVDSRWGRLQTRDSAGKPVQPTPQ